MTDIKNEEAGEKKSLNFIEQAVEKDLKEGKNGGKVQTRFPPEPNGYLHIGHAKAICLDFGIAARHGGVCNLRFDDTNPTKEDVEYVEAIKEDIQWLGYQWGNEYYASDYFQQLWDFAIRLIEEGKAYIDEQTAEQIAQQKGTPTQAGVNSPYRDRPIEESLELFKKMNSGEIEEGAMVLRAKIDMANPNMHFRDPIIYRVVKHPHHRTGTTWKAYPMYDFAHGQSDFFEGVTHSLCTLEFVVHRPLYDLFIDWLKEGKDLTIMANGDTVSIALEAAKKLEEEGIHAQVYDFHTIKPLDVDAVNKAIEENGKIITVEDHNIINGLGSAVCEIVAEAGKGKVHRIGVQDQFGESAPYEELLKKNGITSENIVKCAKDMID